jgi:flagellar biosynthesis protein FliQ
MSDALLFDSMRQALWVAVVISAPILTAALVVGLAIGLFQALTSVQEMTLTFVPKAAAIIAVFWATMTFMTGTLAAFFTDRILPAISGG